MLSYKSVHQETKANNQSENKVIPQDINFQNKAFTLDVFYVPEELKENDDELNILQASLLSMKRAITNLLLKPDFVLIDGAHKPALDIDSENIIKGDNKSLSIAAASIIAKVERDQFMKKIDEEYPHYNWKKNKGYGTKEHQNALNVHGISEHHRKSFSPIRKILSLN